MNLDKLPAETTDNHYNVIIEISMNDNPVKYEFDKEIAAIRVDRFMQTAMFYPCNYGFIPHTLANDGDPVDVLVVSHYPIIPGAVVKVKIIGVLVMEDESGMDEKMIAIPHSKLDITFDKINDIDRLDPMLKNRIEHFFENYKKLEKGKWVKIIAWDNAQRAKELIQQAITNASASTK